MDQDPTRSRSFDPGSALARITRERLRLRGLPHDATLVARALVAVLAVTGAVIVLAVATGASMPGGLMPGPEPSRPRLAFAVFLGGLAVVAAGAALATTLPRARFRVATIATLVLVPAAVGARLLQVSAMGQGSWLLGILTMAGAAVTVVVALAGWRRPRARLLAAAAMVAPCVWLAAEAWALVAGDRPLEAAMVGSVRDHLALLGVAGGALVLWGTFALLRTARAIGTSLAASSAGPVPALLIVVAVKLVWIAVGLMGWVPAELPEARDEWRRAAEDGLAGWTVALVVAAILVAMLTRARRRLDERGVRSGFWVLVGAFSLPTVIAAGVMLGQSLAWLAGTWAAASVLSVAGVAMGFILPVELAVILVLPLLAALAWRLDERSVGVTLLLAWAWLLPIGLAVAWSTAARTAGTSPVDPLVPSQLTVDVLLTLGTLLVCLEARRTGRWRIDPGLLLVAMLVSGVAASTGLLVPAPLAVPVGGLLLVYPVVWTLLVDAGGANLPGPARPVRVVSILVASALLLLLAMLPFATGEDPDGTMTRIARVLMAIPTGAALVLAWWGRQRRLPRLDASVTAERRPPLIDRLDTFGTGWRLVAGSTVLVTVGLMAWGQEQGRLEEVATTSPRPEASGPAGETGGPQEGSTAGETAGTTMSFLAVPAGTIVFGTALDREALVLLDPGEEAPAGVPLTWAARLARPAADGQLELFVEVDDRPYPPLPITYRPGVLFMQESGWLPTSPVPARVRLQYREGDEVLAEGVVRLVDR